MAKTSRISSIIDELSIIFDTFYILYIFLTFWNFLSNKKAKERGLYEIIEDKYFPVYTDNIMLIRNLFYSFRFLSSSLLNCSFCLQGGGLGLLKHFYYWLHDFLYLFTKFLLQIIFERCWFCGKGFVDEYITMTMMMIMMIMMIKWIMTMTLFNYY